MAKIKRRSNGQGTIYQRKQDGLWIGALFVDGKRTVVSSKTRQEANRKLNALMVRRNAVESLRDTLTKLSDKDLTLELVGLLSNVLARAISSLRWKSQIHTLDISHIDQIGEYAGCFVYLLWGENRERPLYIGQTKTILWRLAQHSRLGGSLFAPEIRSVTIIRCQEVGEMEALERELIRTMNPMYNRRHVTIAPEILMPKLLPN